MVHRPSYRSADLTGRTHLLQTSLRILIALALAMLSLPFLSTSASAAPANGIVIDGNRQVDPASEIDWDTFPNGDTTFATYRDEYESKKDNAVPGSVGVDDDIFQGAREEVAPSGWGTRMGGTDTGNDIGRIYSYTASDTAGDAFFYLGFERKQDGVGAFAVELNQKPNLNYGSGFMPQRSLGDVRITFGQGGGNTPLIQVGADRWSGSPAGWTSVGLNPLDYEGLAGEDGLFAELEIDLTASGLQPPCGNGFTQVNLRSRSSVAPSSLKDYVQALDVNILPTCGDLTIHKNGTTTAGTSTLSGARFTITPDPSTATGASLTVTDGGANDPDGLANGVIPFSTARFTTYSVVEVAPPSSSEAYGWVLDPTTRTALVSLTQDGDVTFTNTLGSVAFTKTDQTDDSLVGGASFQLINTTGASQATFSVTDNVGRDLDPDDGEFLVEDLKVGDWTVTELDTLGYPAPPGYTLPSLAPLQGFAVTQANPDATITAAFENPRKTATLTVEKRDEVTEDLVTGSTSGPNSAIFRLYTDTGTIGAYDVLDQVVAGGDKSSDDGTATWAGLPWGQYLVQEVTPPTGYQPKVGAAAYQAVDLGLDDVDGANEVTTVTFENLQRTAQIQVVKFSFENPRVPLSGATFELWKDDGDLVWTNADTRITPVGDVETADQPGSLGNNTFTWPDQLAWGDYLVKEITPPNGYTKDPVAVNDAKLVQIRRADAGSVVSVEFNDPQRPIIPDPVTRDITVTKTDADTGLEVGGAIFELYLDGNIIGEAEVNELRDRVTTPTGTGPSAGTYTWTDLPLGDYLVKEVTPPDGYLPLADSTLEVPTDGDVAFANAQIRSTIVVTKTDAGTPGLRVDGATFELRLDGDDIGAPQRMSTGVYTWSGLLMGDYTVTETIPPPDYLPPSPGSKTQSVSIVGTNAGDPFSVGFQNEKKATTGGGGDPVRTGIVVTKRDLTTNQPIDTATFQLWEDANANGRFDANLDAQVSPAKNTANGVVSWVGLLMGTYFVEETAAPNGYELPANTVLTIIVDGTDAGGTLSRSFYDPQRPTTIELVKQDDKTGRVLAGAVFQAYVDVNEDGTYDVGDTKIGGTKTSGTNGVVSWSGLKFGHYVIREVAPPDGYGLAADTDQSVVLDRDNAGETVQLVFLDPAEDGVAISKVALEQNADGEWVPSDGEVAFGDLVKYEITADAYVATMYRDVNVSDFIPGYDPADTKSTTKASYVNDSATCGSATCAVSFDDTQQLSWSLGDMRDDGRTLEFVVRMPLLAATPVYDETGLLIETIVNVAELSWQEGATESMQRRAAAYGTRSIRSNEVVTTIVDRPEVLDTPPAVQPETVKKPGQLLPDTGAPTHSAMFGTVGSLSLLLGAWLMLVSRGRGYLPQR